MAHFETFAFWTNMVGLISSVIFIVVPLYVAASAPGVGLILFTAFSILCKLGEKILSANFLWNNSKQNQKDLSQNSESTQASKKAIDSKQSDQSPLDVRECLTLLFYIVASFGSGVFAAFLDKKSYFFNLLLFCGFGQVFSWVLGLTIACIFVSSNILKASKGLDKEIESERLKSIRSQGFSFFKQLNDFVTHEYYNISARWINYLKIFINYLKTVVPVFVLLALPSQLDQFILMKSFGSFHYDAVGLVIFVLYALIAGAQVYENYLYTHVWFGEADQSEHNDASCQQGSTLVHTQSVEQGVWFQLLVKFRKICFYAVGLGLSAALLLKCNIPFISDQVWPFLSLVFGKLGQAITGRAFMVDSPICIILGLGFVAVVCVTAYLLVQNECTTDQKASDYVQNKDSFIVIISTLVQFFSVFTGLIIFAHLLIPTITIMTHWYIYVGIVVIALCDISETTTNASKSINADMQRAAENFQSVNSEDLKNPEDKLQGKSKLEDVNLNEVKISKSEIKTLCTVTDYYT